MDSQEHYCREIQAFFRENGNSPDEYQIERLATYAALVAQKNEIVNLISRKDIASIVENHVFISAFISKFIPEKCTKFLDIGTGGGFPGIPLAIVKPALKGVVVDSTAKKINAVCEFIQKLKLSNIIAENDRVESKEFIAKYAKRFDLVVSRATVPLDTLIGYAFPLIQEKAFIMTIKGGDLTTEMNTAELKYKHYIKKHTIFELNYRPTNIRNEKEKKLILLELNK